MKNEAIFGNHHLFDKKGYFLCEFLSGHDDFIASNTPILIKNFG